MSTRPLHLVALRGNAAEFPPNTLPACESALALGAGGLAVDVQIAADGEPMVVCEHELRRLGEARDGSLLDLAAAAAERVEVAERERFGDRHAGLCIPRLAQLVASTPASSGVFGNHLVGSPEAYLAHGRGMEAASFLAGWADTPAAVEALCRLARERPAQTSWAVLRATQRAPSPALREALRAARPSLAALGARCAAEVDAALGD